MSDLNNYPAVPRIPRRRALVGLLAAAGVIVLPGCGGGGGGAGGAVGGVDTGGTGSFSTGRITGFGSVIVNGVRFEDNAARINDDDGAQIGADDLRLGMVVSVQGGAVTAGSGDVLPSASATTISVESQIKGPVESKTGTDTLVVFGQTVKVNTATVFEGTSFAAIAVGQILEVSGFADAAGVVTATRIEREDNANEFKVRGVISNLVGTSFQIGSATFNFSGATRLPATPLANGLFVRVRTQTARNAAGQWVVTRIDLRDAVEDRNEARVEGILVRNGTLLQVNGVTIDTSRLAAGAVPAVGQRVEVEGALVNGVLVARKIDVENEAEDSQVDVRGTASAVNTTAQTFVVRGLTFHYTPGSVREDDGTIAANLVNGAAVRVRGTLPAGGAGNIEATRIDFQP
ncbi:hypothetical protein GCM10028796_01730 [Ramlibacter monticola]|uniref:DUF5666 domain-containing protein n=1 Tax=Ramlibacter monticola TaxID=1926872 RepID=A0A937CTE6_9BURK|nr:DUF5666 domain-containing protein [Ramlibacter monticola]MBL0391533.1 hypothetical protein [Ramlibacter monticola]